MIPLDTVVTTTYSSGPDPVTHFNGFNTALVLGSAAPGYSSARRSMPWNGRPKRCSSRRASTSIGAAFPIRSVRREHNRWSRSGSGC